MTGGQIVGLVTIICLFGGPLIVGVVYAIVNGWKNVAKHREDVDLKHKLVDAGYSADEIVRIMQAGRKKPSPNGPADDLGETHLKVG
ncbi:MAG: hypothetical protein ACE5KM_17580 [Planctomycetaceae bacterium]